MASLRARWADGPDDVPAEGEALGRLQAIPGSSITETIEGGGADVPGLQIDVATGEVSRTEPRRTDLVLSRARYEMVVATADGRRLVASFGSDNDAPQIDADAPPDLRRALVPLWRARPPAGRPSEAPLRIDEIVSTAASMGDAATVDTVAQRLGRVTEMGERQGDYNRDVAAAGGWVEIMRRARAL